MQASDPSCVFCRIVAGEVPAAVVRETDATLAFHDLRPQAPTHVLVIPKHHHRDVAALAAADSHALSALLGECAAVAQAEGVGDGYRVVINNGPGGGQEVPHLHAHVLAGRPFRWPPG